MVFSGHHPDVLASISLTHVYFNPQDKISYAFAYITLAPIAILVFYASVIVSRREMAGILMLLGQLSNEALNYILKEWIEQDRPYVHLGDGYGMPSSHSQFIWYFSVYGSLYMYRYIYLDHTIWKVLTSIAMFSLAILVAASRIYLGYHTLNQVLVGSMVGIGYGGLWYGITRWMHSVGVIQWAINSSIAKKLYLRDMSAVHNVAKWDYEQFMKIKTK